MSAKAKKAKIKEPVVEKPEIEVSAPKDDIFSTDSSSVVANLIKKGFHVKEHRLVDEKLIYVFKEPKSVIEKD